MKWYELIEYDDVLKHKIVTFAQDFAHNHNKNVNFLDHTLVYEIIHELMRDMYNRNYGGGNIDTYNHTALESIILNISKALFTDLLENNTNFMKSIILHFLRVQHDSVLEQMEIDGYLATSHVRDTREWDVKDNSEYNYWWDYSKITDAIIVLSDHEKTPTDGLAQFKYEFDDSDDMAKAIADATILIDKLYTGEMQLESFIQKIEPTRSPVKCGYEYTRAVTDVL